MPTLAYLDCSSGICGDMLLAALIDAGAPLERINDAIGSLGLPNCRVTVEEVRRGGFRTLKAHVQAEPEHVHRHLAQITARIDVGRLSARQKDLAKRIFVKLAEAEAKVHGTSVEEVHFHEVGAADSIADVVGTAVGFDLLGVERIIASPVPTGAGRIVTAHGPCSIPAPATAELLRGIPLADVKVEGELTTPTGAAVLAALADSFGPPPAMTIRRIGCGAGDHEFPTLPNILRLFLGESVESLSAEECDQVCQLETNLDDLSGQFIGHCVECLREAGALEVFTTPVSMKKDRPGVLLTVLCRVADESRLTELIFRETTTLGVRRSVVSRRILPRQPHTVTTPFGPVAGKLARLPDGTRRFSPEYDSCRRLAREQQRPLREIHAAALQAFDPNVDG
ncbi:MAG: nickel pincer cofactor biosynthesis protein LarC [Pirellulales bacterium]|nr:nickel pincer cofactor biosynthesis protein LarC [Pirellulales bacterium]